MGGGGEEEDGSGQLQEEGRHPLPSQKEIYGLCCFLINFLVSFCSVSKDILGKLIINVAINNHIILLLYEANTYI